MAQEISKDYTLQSPKSKRFSRFSYSLKTLILKIKVVPITDSRQKQRIIRADSLTTKKVIVTIMNQKILNILILFQLLIWTIKGNTEAKHLISIVEKQKDKLFIFSRESTIKRKSEF